MFLEETGLETEKSGASQNRRAISLDFLPVQYSSQKSLAKIITK